MRICGGEYKKKEIKVPRQGVRPTTGRVREIIFNTLGPRTEGARVLDLFAGSGALGLEAYSWGANSVCFVESSRASFFVLKQNVTNLLVPGGLNCFCSDVFDWMTKQKGARQFDLIFADPPYGDGYMEKTLAAILENDMLKADGLVIFELAGRDKAEPGGHWKLVKEKGGGNTRILFLSRA
ncbi:MAG: 16S rRNA (guanine966-N2)-methyltransferase [Kiritimatiellia bacterium]|jgi:16S rRNA (guanine966-N2)-methyltransferase